MIQYSLDEVTIKPCGEPTEISSRSEVNPFRNGKLPIFVAPMTSVIDKYNWDYFSSPESNVIPIVPRGVDIFPDEIDENTWKAVSLKEFEDIVLSDTHPVFNNILIDMANGHIKKIYNLARKCKLKFKDVKLMAGNIANSELMYYAAISGIDYLRTGIGGGNACTTSVFSGIHTSLPTLLQECKDIQTKLELYASDNYPSRLVSTYYMESEIMLAKELGVFTVPKIIADGGINTFAKAIKCLALGADYVMMGSVFAHCIESANVIYAKSLEDAKKGVGYDKETARSIMSYGKGLSLDYKPYSHYYGMASTLGAKDLGKDNIKAPEGLETWYECNWSLDEFTAQFEAYLRSAMTYTGSYDLDEFKLSEICIQSINEFNSYNK